MRWLADFLRAGITGVMWMVVGVLSVVILAFSFESYSLLGMGIGLVALAVMILVAMGITVALWRVALTWQGTGTRAEADAADPVFAVEKEKRDTAHLMERLVDNLDDDELVELETLLMSRADMRQSR